MGYGDELFNQLAGAGLYPRFNVTLAEMNNMGYSGFNLMPFDIDDLNNTLENMAYSEMMTYGYGEFDQKAFEKRAIKSYLLIRAIAMTNRAQVQQALNLGADPNEPSFFRGKRYTPIVLAAQNGDMALVRTMVDAGADVNLTTLGGESAIGMASYFDNYDLADYLLKKGADPNVVAHGGITPLSVAENAKMIELLLRHGADPNIPDNDGDLPIIARIDNYDRDSIKALVHAGTNLDHRNKMGISARQHLARSGISIF